jgi:hypothetical protein
MIKYEDILLNVSEKQSGRLEMEPFVLIRKMIQLAYEHQNEGSFWVKHIEN